MQRNVNFKDLTGQTFGYLTALYVDESKTTPKHLYWFCKCVCGKTRSLQTNQLTMNRVTSCGCMNQRQVKNINIGSHKRLYSTYNAMLSRCHNPNNAAFNSYGGKGITVCEEWRSDFHTFKEWALNNGYSDTLSIDRIDNSKGYSPDNCRWIPLREQQFNRSNNVYYTHNGETHIMFEWADILGLSRELIKSRRKTAKRKNIDPTFEYIFRPLYTPVKK
jgi:hypothetical protein